MSEESKSYSDTISPAREARVNRTVENLFYYLVGAGVGVILTLFVMSQAKADVLTKRLPEESFAFQRMKSHSVYTPASRETKDTARYRVGIIDTGYNGDFASTKLKLCKTGHYDFYSESSVVAATAPHGSHVASLIAGQLADVDYCAVIYQVVDKTGNLSVQNVVRALQMASKQHLTALNMSLTGPQSFFYEQKVLQVLSDDGTQIFVAAGNDRKDLDYACNAFPACYGVTNLQVVGALTPDVEGPAAYSNYGTRVKLWYPGFYTDGIDTFERGTSFACPRALADYVFSVSLPAK